jgi:hypothetical protein
LHKDIKAEIIKFVIIFYAQMQRTAKKNQRTGACDVNIETRSREGEEYYDLSS